MEEVFTYDSSGLQTAASRRDATWINFVNPEREELVQLAHEEDMPLEFLTAALDPDERARFEVEDDTTLILLRLPLLNQSENSDIPYVTRPLAMVFKDHRLFTICLTENPILDDFLEGKVKNFDPTQHLRVVLQVFYRTAIRYLRYLRELNTRSNLIELELQKSQKNADLIKLLNYEKSLVFFTTSLRSNQIMIDRFKRTRFFRQAAEEERDLLEDITIDMTQAIEMANIYTTNLSGLMDAFASVISNNLNSVMKTLTQITIILMVPTFVASLYGMNVSLPGQDSPWAFSVLLGICLLLFVGGYLLFSNRKLF